ncbi:hypothetical protein E2C01_085897 [Portunus trituberculatus]|uniref:Uncharacterized protein n=1 Tax=Portunus trituberculatus TaxID=210409 RepID=A0A5B7J8U3_PORTR|nr:hypothetical protein [Portunus trituberculatus]
MVEEEKGGALVSKEWGCEAAAELMRNRARCHLIAAVSIITVTVIGTLIFLSSSFLPLVKHPQIKGIPLHHFPQHWERVLALNVVVWLQQECI